MFYNKLFLELLIPCISESCIEVKVKFLFSHFFVVPSGIETGRVIIEQHPEQIYLWIYLQICNFINNELIFHKKPFLEL